MEGAIKKKKSEAIISIWLQSKHLLLFLEYALLHEETARGLVHNSLVSISSQGL